MSDYIPSELYRDILLRLPAATLLRLRSVCKTWLNIIDDPIFARSHQLLPSNNNNNTLLIGNQKGSPIYLINLDSIDFTKSHFQLIDAIPVEQLIRRRGEPLAKPQRKTCNGLILISSDDDNKEIWAIWNPFNRSFHQLPPPPLDDAGSLLPNPAMGLAFDCVADDYRVVRIDKEHGTHVYSLNLGCWRRIKDCPFDFGPRILCRYNRFFFDWCDHNGVFLNGALYWLSRDMVFVLDLGTEEYSHLALPPPMPTLQRDLFFDVQLDAVGGCLSLTLFEDRRHRFIGWVMKDYGAEWVKLFTLNLGHCRLYGERPRRLVAFLESKNQVLLEQDRSFLWYDIENGVAKQVNIHGRSISSSQICPESIKRLNESGNVGSRKRKRNKIIKSVSTRLNLRLRDCDTITECCSSGSRCLFPYAP